MRIKKVVSLLVLCVFMISSLGCSKNTSASSGKKIKIFASFSGIREFHQTIVDGMNSYGKANNMEVAITDSDGVIEKQVNDIKKAKADGYDVISCALADTDTAQQIINAAGNLPVIFFSNEPDASRLKKDKYIFVASNENEVVDMTAKAIEKKFADKKSFNAVLLEGDRNSKCAIIRSDSLKNRLMKDGYDINYVFEDSAFWERDNSKKVFKVFLNLKKDYQCIICNNDDMAMGAIDAMKEAEIDPASVSIYGVDATSKGCEAIQNGEMTFTIKQSGEGQAKCIIEAARALVEGKSISDIKYADKSGKYIWYPYTAVDKNNVSKFLK